MDGLFSDDFLTEVDGWLAPADAQAALFAGESGRRQPVHTVYVPADRYRADTPQRWGEQALALLDEHAPAPARFAAMTGLAPVFIHEVYPRMRAKLTSQPIEDLRIDFEDGYGVRPDDEEDAAASAAGIALAGSAGAADAPLMAGIRIKGLHAVTRRRGLRTLDLLVRAAVHAGGLPERFVVTLPKVAHVAEVSTAVRICERLERAHGLVAGAIRFELQIEVPQAVVGPDGTATVARLVHAADGRCEGLHYGTYDFSAAAGVIAGEQSLEHPLADHAKAVMQLAAAQTGVRVSDGSTNVVPVGSTHAVGAAWRLHARLVQRSLRRALYQGWDLHAGHLVTRYAATYDFYRAQLQPSCTRLADYSNRAASGFMDEPATALALAAVVLRAVDCGACDDDEVSKATGIHRSALLALAGRPAEQV
jgi:HpcH/HpaI aldolase/citrate lyase family